MLGTLASFYDVRIIFLKRELAVGKLGGMFSIWWQALFKIGHCANYNSSGDMQYLITKGK
jgi:hypothetical protein